MSCPASLKYATFRLSCQSGSMFAASLPKKVMKSTCPVLSWAMPGAGTLTSLPGLTPFSSNSAWASRYGDPPGTAPKDLPATSWTLVMPLSFSETNEDGLVW